MKNNIQNSTETQASMRLINPFRPPPEPAQPQITNPCAPPPEPAQPPITNPFAAMTASVLDIALLYGKRGYRVFPLRPNSKEPAMMGWPAKASSDAAAIGAMSWAGGIGIATGGDECLLVLDIDSDKREGVADADRTAIKDSLVWKRLEPLLDAARAAQPDKFIHKVGTPRGGCHYYIRVTGCPNGPADLKQGADVFGTKASDGVALDTRGEKGYVAAYGTFNGGSYEQIDDAELDELVCVNYADLVAAGILKASKPAAMPLGGVLSPVQTFSSLGAAESPDKGLIPFNEPLLIGKGAHAFGGFDRSNPVEVRDALMFVIRKTNQPTDGRDFWRDSILFPLVGAVARNQLMEDEGRAIYDTGSELAGGSTECNEAQWGVALADAKAKLAAGEPMLGLDTIFRKAEGHGWVVPLSVKVMAGRQVELAAGPDGSQLDDGGCPGGYGKDRLPTVNVQNAKHLMQRAGASFAFNERSQRHTVCVTAALAGAVPGLSDECSDFGDRHARLLADYLAIATARSWKPVMINEAALTAGDASRYDPVRDMLDDLPAWDKTPRLGTWLQVYCGVADTLLNREFGRLWLMAGIARAYQPGCKFDQVLVLLGVQGAGKSSVGKILANGAVNVGHGGDDFFVEADLAQMDEKQIIEKAGSALIVELAEMSSASKRDQGKVKGLLSATSDRARLAYAQSSVSVPRRFIFLATDNSEQLFGDDTGNRRYWPVTVGTTKLIDLAADRNQLWAEAKHAFQVLGKSNPACLALHPSLYAAARAVQQAHTSRHGWQEWLDEWLVSRALTSVGLPTVTTHDMGLCHSLGYVDIITAANLAGIKGITPKTLKLYMERQGWSLRKTNGLSRYLKSLGTPNAVTVGAAAAPQ